VNQRFEFIEAEKATFPIASLCRALGVSRSGFHGWRSREPTERARRRHELTTKVEAAFKESRGTYGSPRVHEALQGQGEKVSKNTVADIMQERGLQARPKKRFKATTDSRSTKRIAPNLLARDFTAERPNQAWVTDVKAIWTHTGWLYLAAIIDLFGRRCVGWALSNSNDTELASCALMAALERRTPDAGLTHHSDRGSPYGSDAYIAILDKAGAIRSMSRKGDCWDNAVAESFFSTLEFECLRRRTFTGFDDTHAVLDDYINSFYNPHRLHSANGYVSPVELELRAAALQMAA
jgi:putative transposase